MLLFSTKTFYSANLRAKVTITFAKRTGLHNEMKKKKSYDIKIDGSEFIWKVCSYVSLR